MLIIWCIVKIINCSWSEESLKNQLPLQPGEMASLTLNIYAAANFLSSSYIGNELSSGIFGSSHASSMMSASAGPSSLPSRLNSPIHGTMSGSFHLRRNDLTASFR